MVRAKPLALLLLLLLAACTPIQAPAAPADAELPPVPAPVLATEAIPDVLVDEAVSLAGEWRMQQVAQFTPDMAEPDFDDSGWPTVSAPARWADQGLGELTSTGAVVVYRRMVDLPAAWADAAPGIGISAWFNPYGSQLFVNGQKLEPLRTPFAPYADVTDQVAPGGTAQVTVVAQYDGLLEYADALPPRIGPLGTRAVVAVEQSDGAFATPTGEATYTLYAPQTDGALPALLLFATGSHGLAELGAWADTATDLARSGYVAAAVALPSVTTEGIQAALELVAADPRVDPAALYVWGADEAATTVAAAAGLPVRGVIVLGPPMWNKLPDVGDKPVLLMAAAEERGGMVVNQLAKLAGPLGDQATLVTLPGEGHGLFLLTNAWNDVRAALLGWLAAHP